MQLFSLRKIQAKFFKHVNGGGFLLIWEYPMEVNNGTNVLKQFPSSMLPMDVLDMLFFHSRKWHKLEDVIIHINDHSCVKMLLQQGNYIDEDHID
jgi:hypothetical protein